MPQLYRGKHYVHPEDGLITITDGYYLDPTSSRVSNHWHWTIHRTGETGHGYGGDWPEAEIDVAAETLMEQNDWLVAIDWREELLRFRALGISDDDLLKFAIIAERHAANVPWRVFYDQCVVAIVGGGRHAKKGI